MSRKSVAIALMAVLGCMGAGSSQAGVTLVDLSAGSNWRSTVDPLLATQWNNGNLAAGDGLTAYSPYLNADTLTLNANRAMWHCDPQQSNCTGEALGGGGFTEAFFVRQFDIKPGAKVQGAFAIIADDFVRLQVNGQFVFDALLVENRDANGQPVPLIFDIDGFDFSLRSGNALDLGGLSGVLHSGTNTFVLQAMDGELMNGPFNVDDCIAQGGRPIPNDRCFMRGDNAYEYMFLSGSLLVVPEPSVPALAGMGLAGLAALRRRRGTRA